MTRSTTRAGKPSWVDISGPNLPSAVVLAQLFPDARFINMVRDGRAVTAIDCGSPAARC